MLPSKPKVLIIAEACNPEMVSVPLVGWSLSNALRDFCDAHIVTQVRNKDALVRAGLIEGRDFTAIDSEAVARPLWKAATVLRMGEGKGWTTTQAIGAISYVYFEHLVWKTFGGAIQRGEYDIVHRVTPLSPTVSSRIAPRCRKVGVPFVIGPLNGGVPWPKGFDAERRREREWLSYVRSAYKLLPGRRATLKAASAILVGSRHTQSEMPQQHEGRVVYLPENGIDPERFSLRATPGQGNTPLRAVFVGRLVPYKGPDMLIEAALPFLRDGTLALDIIGDGPMMDELRAQADRERVSDGVVFHGWQKHQNVQEIMVQTDFFAFPSIREFGGGVVLEAMALGLAPMIVDYAGPGELVQQGTGFAVPIGPRQQIIARMAVLLGEIVEGEHDLGAIGDRAKALVDAKFTWAQKARQVSRVYDWVLTSEAGPAPDVLK